MVLTVLSLSTQEEKSDKERWQHLADLADFALAMKDTLTNINNQSFNNFMLRIGKGTGSAGALSRLDLKGEGRLVGKSH